jgi:hypothetical protein
MGFNSVFKGLREIRVLYGKQNVVVEFWANNFLELYREINFIWSKIIV